MKKSGEIGRLTMLFVYCSSEVLMNPLFFNANMRKAVNAAIMRDHAVLLVQKRDVWILPGGKPLEGEGEVACLIREVKEELSRAELYALTNYGTFQGTTPHAGDMLEAKVYLAGIIPEDSKPSAEITNVLWYHGQSEINLSDITQKIVDQLVHDGFVRYS